MHAGSGTGFCMNLCYMTCNMLFFSLCFYCCVLCPHHHFDLMEASGTIHIWFYFNEWKYNNNNSDKKGLKIPKGGNQNPYIEVEQTTQWPKQKVQKDKQRSTKHTHETKDWVTHQCCHSKYTLRKTKEQSKIDNPETLATFGTQDKRRGQTKHKSTTQKTKKVSNTGWVTISMLS